PFHPPSTTIRQSAMAVRRRPHHHHSTAIIRPPRSSVNGHIATIRPITFIKGNALAWWKAYKQAKGGDVWLITVTCAIFKELFFLQFFPRAEQERLKREYHSIRQTDTETSTEFMQRFLRLARFLGAAAGNAEEQAKNFQWGLRRSTLNHLMCIPFTDVAQVSNDARNYEILHERDDDDAERPDKR
nr:zinc finger, CCHC-type, retrotransposon Gag domain protein [Tanacetum cinerariifolium]